MTLRIYLFGTPRCLKGERVLQIQRRKGQALLSYLALNPQPQARELLATLFYPESEQALAYLRRDLAELKRQVGKEVLAVDRDLSLSPHAALWVDVLAFQARLELVAVHAHFPQQACAECLVALQEAIALYNDDFLAGFSLPDSAAFEEWQRFQSQALRHDLAEALQKVISWHEAAQTYAAAIGAARRWSALDPLHEAAQRSLMELYAASGQRAAALRQYEECLRLLDEELGVVPAMETTALFEAIRTGRFGSPQWGGEEHARRAAVHNPPALGATFVGRDEEMAEIRRMLRDPHCRLLTLVGPGGVGKTRLALETARVMHVAGGVCFVSLAALSAAASLPDAIAGALKIQLHGSSGPQEALLERLERRELLLILDGFEQLLPEGADFIVALLQRAPRVQLLVTSRERLDLRAERTFLVSGLNYPTQEHTGELESFSAAQLFLQCALRSQGDFTPSPAARAAIGRICRLTEGIPLALELAATWTTTLSCAEIAEEIQRSVGFLSSTLRDLPDRHRSMRAVFESSWELLDGEERQLYRQLSIFRNGFTRSAAEAICQLPAGDRSILQLLAALLAKSLLRRSAAGRYEMHELLRQYGAARLAQDPVVENRARRRHCHYYLQLCARQESRLKGSEQLSALQQLSAELDNLRAAWQHAARQAYGQLMMQAAEGAWLFLVQSSRINYQDQAALLDLAINRLQQANESEEAASTSNELALAKLQALNAGVYMRVGDAGKALVLAQQSLAQLQRLEAWREVALALNMLAATLHLLGDYDVERAALQESVALARKTGDRWLAGYSLNDLAMATYLLGDTEEAQRLSRESMALFRQLGDWRGLAFALDNLGLFAYHLADYVGAEKYYRECLSIRQTSEDPWGVATTLSHLVMVAQARGDNATARTHLLQALRAAQRVGAWSLLLDTLVRLAHLFCEEGEIMQAQQILQYCLSHPALGDALRERAEWLLAAYAPGKEEAALSAVTPSLEALVASLLDI